MNFQIEYTGTFKKDFKRIVKRGYNIELLRNVIQILETKGNLPLQFKSHKLVSKYINYWECHISSDWLLIWKFEKNKIILVRTGTHSDLFK